MKFERCLITSDFDGTFYADDGAIQPPVIRAIRYFISRGGSFTISTGRVMQGFQKYDPTYINAPVLLANGASAYDYDKKQYLFLSGIGREGIPLINGLMREFPDMSIEIYTPYHIYCIRMSESTKHHFTSQMFHFQQINGPEQAEFPWTKVMLDAKENTRQVQNFLRCFCSDPIFLPTTGNFVEILKKGVDKGSGLFRLADRLHIPHERTFAVGDGYNDVDMLKAAKYGFVPENGDSQAKAAADYIVRSNNDGAVANVIEILDSIL